MSNMPLPRDTQFSFWEIQVVERAEMKYTVTREFKVCLAVLSQWGMLWKPLKRRSNTLTSSNDFFWLLSAPQMKKLLSLFLKLSQATPWIKLTSVTWIWVLYFQPRSIFHDHKYGLEVRPKDNWKPSFYSCALDSSLQTEARSTLFLLRSREAMRLFLMESPRLRVTLWTHFWRPKELGDTPFDYIVIF